MASSANSTSAPVRHLTVVPFKPKPIARRRTVAKPSDQRFADIIRNTARVADMVERLQRAVDENDHIIFRALVGSTLVEARYAEHLAKQMSAAVSA